MKYKLSGIINTDCYVQFDTNEQLREWVKKHFDLLSFEGKILQSETTIRFNEFTNACWSVQSPKFNHPIHHHTNIEI